MVVLRGEPGVGKSRLVAEVRRRPGAEGVRWLEGRALSFGRHLSYWPFIEIVKTCCAIEETDTEGQAWAKLEATVRDLFGPRAPEIVPYLATVLALEMTGEHEQRLKFLDTQALGRQVFLSMHQLFEQLAQRRPLVLVMEDWHWVDQSSIALSEHLVPLAGNHPVAFWFATRAEPGEPAARVRQVAQSHDGGVPFHEIALAPLGDAQGGALVDHLVAHLPETVRDQIVRRTEGNPFFIEEVVRALISDGTLVKGADGAWRLARPLAALILPETVQGVIAARIDRLEDGVKNVLKLASVIGRSFFLRILEAIAGGRGVRGGRAGRPRARRAGSLAPAAAGAGIHLQARPGAGGGVRQHPGRTTSCHPHERRPGPGAGVRRARRRVHQRSGLPLRAGGGLGEGPGVPVQGR
jgi:predicted ATPase